MPKASKNLLNYFLQFLIFLNIVMSLLNVELSLWVSIAFIFFLSISLLRRSITAHGYINLTNLFIALFITGILTLLPRCFDDSYVTGLHSVWYQTTELFEKVAQISLLAFSCLYLGWLLKRDSNSIFGIYSARIDLRVAEIFFWISSLMGFVFSFLFKPEITIMTATYGEVLQSRQSDLMAANAVALFCTLIVFYVYLLKPGFIKKIVFLSLFFMSVVYCGFFAGGRVEQLGCLIGLVFIYQWVKKIRIDRKFLMIGGFVVFLILTIVGLMRSGNLDSRNSNLNYFLSNSGFLSTQKDVMTTSLIVFGLKNDGMLEVDYGKTIWDVVVSILPASWDSDRPQQFDKKISLMTEWPGGTFIVNEPYVAGDVFGVAILFSFLGWAFKHLEKLKENVYGFIIYLGVLGGMPRLVYYGLMPAYRFLTISLCFCLIYWFLVNAFQKTNFTSTAVRPGHFS